MHLGGYISELNRKALQSKLRESELDLLAFLAYYQSVSGPFYTYEVVKALNKKGKSIKYKNVHKPLNILLESRLIEPYKGNITLDKKKRTISGEGLARAKKRNALFYQISPSGWIYFWAKAAEVDRLGKMTTKQEDYLEVFGNGIDALRLILNENQEKNTVLTFLLHPYFEIETITLLTAGLNFDPEVFRYLKTCCNYLIQAPYGDDYEAVGWRISYEVKNLALTLLFAHGERPLPVAINTRSPDIDELPAWPYSGAYQHSKLAHARKATKQKVSEQEKNEVRFKRRFSAHLFNHHSVYSLLAHDEKFMNLFEKVQSEIEGAHKSLEKYSLEWAPERTGTPFSTKYREEPLQYKEKQNQKLAVYTKLRENFLW